MPTIQVQRQICEFPAGFATSKSPALTYEAGSGHWCLRNVPTKDEWEPPKTNGSWGNKLHNRSRHRELTFILKVSGLTCRFKRTATVKGTYTTTTAEHKVAVFTKSNDTGKAGVEFAKEEVSRSS